MPPTRAADVLVAARRLTSSVMRIGALTANALDGWPVAPAVAMNTTLRHHLRLLRIMLVLHTRSLTVFRIGACGWPSVRGGWTLEPPPGSIPRHPPHRSATSRRGGIHSRVL